MSRPVLLLLPDDVDQFLLGLEALHDLTQSISNRLRIRLSTASIKTRMSRSSSGQFLSLAFMIIGCSVPDGLSPIRSSSRASHPV